MRFLKKIVLGVVVYWVIFVLLMIITFFIKGMVPDTLIQYALGGGVIELVVTALIELFKPWAESKVKQDIDADDGLIFIDIGDDDDEPDIRSGESGSVSDGRSGSDLCSPLAEDAHQCGETEHRNDDRGSGSESGTADHE